MPAAESRMRRMFQSALRSGERSDQPEVAHLAKTMKFQSALRSGERSDSHVLRSHPPRRVSIRAPLG